MEIKDDLIAFRIRQFFTNCMESYVSVENRVILISHCGVFSQDLINSLVEGNEELMSSVGDKKVLIKRVFSILIEGLQNIRAHGGKDEEGKQIGFIVISKEKETYKLNFGNIINKTEKASIISKIDHLNSLPTEDVKILYMKVLTNDLYSEKGGAGLGFITMKMKSNNDLSYSIIPLTEKQSLFSLEIILNRIL